ncbi:response regulator, partial [Klebsiella pneumoniae]|uniref:response regulator n=1 Tax=Klebsiella pneumoniae TaxID=573 RepID=UPI003A89E8F3
IDLVISDINMPKMNGLEMCEQIKKLNPEIPLVITSAHNDTNFLKKAIEVGVNTYAMKPIDLYQLIESIIKAVEPIFLKRKLIELNLSL